MLIFIVEDIWNCYNMDMKKTTNLKLWRCDMKKYLVTVLMCIIVLGLCSCGGNVDNVKTHEVESQIYSQEDISKAIKTIEKEFEKNWKGCTLTEIYYAGDDEISNEYKDWTNRNEAHEVIVLVSSFDVDSSGGDGSLNPNETYDDWKWILVRDNGGQWKHVDHGY